MVYRFWVIVAVMMLSIACWANDSTDVAKPAVAKKQIYGGTQVKLDVLSPIITVATNKGRQQHYEIGVNVRLAQRFYPTLELGYAGGTKSQKDTLTYQGHGGFFRVGCDINPLKKHADSPHALLIGVRLGAAVQEYTQDAVREETTTTVVRNTDFMMHRSDVQGDCWGEIVLGCQVEIAKVKNTSFYMGWMGRFKCLFTRQLDGYAATEMRAIYIPGFGNRDNIGWGANYYLGWRF
ncbi:MAG: DUF6048 family protein [Bacteroidales bacterium]|nr:DUF6048 family protein [Bacteroidales bacterium]